MKTATQHDCPHCVKKANEEMRNDEMGLAILIMLMPAMTLTILSNAGLF